MQGSLIAVPPTLREMKGLARATIMRAKVLGLNKRMCYKVGGDQGKGGEIAMRVLMSSKGPMRAHQVSRQLGQLL